MERRILIVDRDETDAYRRRNKIASSGYSTQFCKTIDEAREAAEEQRFDCILYAIMRTDSDADFIGNLRAKQRDAKIIVYAEQNILDKYRTQIENSDALPFAFSKNIDQILDALK